MRHWISLATLGLLLLGGATPASAGTTVAVAPFSTDAGPEYHWIGSALGHALVLRALGSPELNVMTLRQANAAMRHDRLKPEDLGDAEKAIILGQQLGADRLVTGTFSATWPDIRIFMKIYDPNTKKLVGQHNVDGGLDDLFAVEARLARALAGEIKTAKLNVARGGFGTTNLRAWRLTTLAQELLNWQSLSPGAADSKKPLRLPEAAVKQALKQLEEATGHDPKYPDAWATLGLAQALLGDSGTAKKSLAKATGLQLGHSPAAILGASFIEMREGRWEAATNVLTKALERHPGFCHARGYLGELHAHRKNFPAAIKVFDDYLAAVPKQPWVLAQRGYAKSKAGEHNGAIADTIAAVDQLPDSAYLLLELASRYIDANKLIGAEDALLQLVKKHPSHARAYIRLGYVYLRQNKNHMVVPITEKALLPTSTGATARDRAYAHANLVRAYARQNDLNRAFLHMEKLVAAAKISLDEIENDPKLEKFRQDPRYGKYRQ